MGLLVVVLTFLVGTLVAQGAHWLAHQRWTGPLYRYHMDHHIIQYPKDDLFSTQYRHSEFTSFTFEHIIAGYIVGTAILLYWLCPLWVPITFLVESGLLSALHVYIHEAFHVEGTFMERVPGFDWYRHIHVIHHYNMQKNLGIVWFMWDRIFGTYKREISDDKK